MGIVNDGDNTRDYVNLMQEESKEPIVNTLNPYSNNFVTPSRLVNNKASSMRNRSLDFNEEEMNGNQNINISGALVRNSLSRVRPANSQIRILSQIESQHYLRANLSSTPNMHESSEVQRPINSNRDNFANSLRSNSVNPRPEQ